MKKFFVCLALTTALVGCDTVQAPQYMSNSNNTIKLMELAAAGEKANVASVSFSQGVDDKPSCRLMGELDIAGGSSTAEKIKGAIQKEFLEGNVYSSNGTGINVTMTQMDVSTLNGTWDLAAKVTSNKNVAGFVASSSTDYKTSFSAMYACDNAAKAFNVALGELINRIVTHPDFPKTI